MTEPITPDEIQELNTLLSSDWYKVYVAFREMADNVPVIRGEEGEK
jgi:hypothetical protein